MRNRVITFFHLIPFLHVSVFQFEFANLQEDLKSTGIHTGAVQFAGRESTGVSQGREPRREHEESHVNNMHIPGTIKEQSRLDFNSACKHATGVDMPGRTNSAQAIETLSYISWRSPCTHSVHSRVGVLCMDMTLITFFPEALPLPSRRYPAAPRQILKNHVGAFAPEIKTTRWIYLMINVYVLLGLATILSLQFAIHWMDKSREPWIGKPSRMAYRIAAVVAALIVAFLLVSLFFIAHMQDTGRIP